MNSVKTAKITRIIAFPIMILIFLCMIFGGIWLGIQGEWPIIFIGIAYTILGSFLFGLALLPVSLLLPLANCLLKRNNPLAWGVVFIGQLYGQAVIVATCAYAVHICFGKFGPSPDSGILGLLPFALWSVGMALGPWQSRAAMPSEQENEFTQITHISTSICYIIFLGSLLIGSVFPITAVILPLSAIALFLFVQLLFVPILIIRISIKQRRAEILSNLLDEYSAEEIKEDYSEETDEIVDEELSEVDYDLMDEDELRQLSMEVDLLDVKIKEAEGLDEVDELDKLEGILKEVEKLEERLGDKAKEELEEVRNLMREEELEKELRELRSRSG